MMAFQTGVMSPPCLILGNVFYFQKGPPKFLGVFAETIQTHAAGSELLPI